MVLVMRGTNTLPKRRSLQGYITGIVENNRAAEGGVEKHRVCSEIPVRLGI